MIIVKPKQSFSKTVSKVSAALKALLLTSFFISGVIAQEMDTAYVPFIVNVNAKVKAEFKDGVDIVYEYEMDVEANKEDTLKIPLEKTTSVMLGTQNVLNNAPVIKSNHRGNVSLNLSGQIYRNAEISLYSVNGKRILRAKTDASQAAKNISRPNLAAGVYLLSVKSAAGQSFSSRLTHRGGSLNINIAFGGSESFSPVLPVAMAKTMLESDGWTITVSADGYYDFAYPFAPVKGINPVQSAALNPIPVLKSDSGKFNQDIDYGSFTDTRGGIRRIYRTVKIDNVIWMAENLNYAGEYGDVVGVCYRNSPDSCDKYGRLYSWPEAMSISSEYDNTLLDGDDADYQGICPDGWRLPGDSDWDNLAVFVSGDEDYNLPGSILKSQTGWESSTTGSSSNGTDKYGFSAIPGGTKSGSNFYYAGGNSYWWSATEFNASSALYWNLQHDYKQLNNNAGSGSKGVQMSVRCVQK